MPELRCEVQTCAHNQQMYCDLQKIEVGGEHATTKAETSCKSFVERKGNQYSNSMKEATATSEVDCKATECQYNHTCKCHAGKINVSGNDACRTDETLCATFQYGK